MKLIKSTSFIKALAVFTGLFSFTFLICYGNYTREVNRVNKQTSDLIELKKDKIAGFLELVHKEMLAKADIFNQRESFSERLYLNHAVDFTNRFPAVLAFNFMHENYKIARVFPYERNKKAVNINIKNHPDEEISKIINGGLSRDEITITPPVEILQGGTALVFYAPVEFKDNQKGWINVVIRVDQLFSDFINKSLNIYSKLIVIDTDTNRFLYKSDDVGVGEKYVSKSERIIGRVFEFRINTTSLISDTFKNTAVLFFVVVLIIFVFCVFLYFGFERNEKIKENLVDAKNERNLLRIIFHDLSSPLMALGFGLEDLKEQDSGNKGVISNLQKQVGHMEEVLNSLKKLEMANMISSNEAESPEVIRGMFQELASLHQNLIEKKSLRIDMEIKGDSPINKSIPNHLLKNEVLNNLFSNAIKYSVPGSKIEIEIKNDSLSITNETQNFEENLLSGSSELEPLSKKANMNSASGHGFGIYIAKIVARKFGMVLDIEQSRKTKKVISKLHFSSN